MTTAQARRLSGEPGTELSRVHDRRAAHNGLEVAISVADQVRAEGAEAAAGEPRSPRPRRRPWDPESLDLLVRPAGRDHFDVEAVAQQLPRAELAQVCVVSPQHDDTRPVDRHSSLLAPPEAERVEQVERHGPRQAGDGGEDHGGHSRSDDGESRRRYAAPPASPPASATFHANHSRGAPAGRIRSSAIHRNAASADSAATATQAAASAPPAGMNTSPRTNTSTSATPFATAIARCARPAISPSCHVWTRKSGIERECLDPQDRRRRDVFLAAHEPDPGLGQDGNADDQQRCDEQRCLGHALEAPPQAGLVLVPGHGEQRQRDREHERGKREQHLKDPERRAKEAGLDVVREERHEHDEHADVDHAHRERDRERQRLAQQPRHRPSADATREPGPHAARGAR